MRIVDLDDDRNCFVGDDGDYERWNIDPEAIIEIVRCKDCKYYEIAWLKKDGTDDKRYKPSVCVRGQYGITREPDWFCADAERKQ